MTACGVEDSSLESYKGEIRRKVPPSELQYDHSKPRVRSCSFHSFEEIIEARMSMVVQLGKRGRKNVFMAMATRTERVRHRPNLSPLTAGSAVFLT